MVTIFYKVKVVSKPEMSDADRTGYQPNLGSRRKSMKVVPARPSELESLWEGDRTFL